MKYLLLFVIQLFLSLPSNAQKAWDGNRNSLLRIEIDQCGNSIKLLPEGLVCATFDSKGKEHAEIFILWDLEYESLLDVENFLLNEPFIFKDTTIDDPYSATSRCAIEFQLIRNGKITSIIWKDGECKELNTCLALLNNLIPKKKRKLYAIKPLFHP